MINRRTSYIIILSILLSLQNLSKLNGQFIRIELSVDADITLTDSRNMAIGFVRPGFGWVRIGPLDDFAGRITAIARDNITFHVTWEAPAELIKNENNKIPVELEAGYNNTQNKGARFIKPFNGNRASFQINESGLPAEKIIARGMALQTTLYFFGQAYVGDIEPGVYSGEIYVKIEYE